MPETSVHERSARLPPEPGSAGDARRSVSRLLEETGLAELVDVAVLLVSETVTNALLHAGTEIGLRCRADGRTLRVEVSDTSAVLPGVRHYDAQATTGRGLGLVEVLASAWGVEPHDRGKTIWFELTAGDVAEPSPPIAEPPPVEVASDRFLLRLRTVPVELARATVQYGDALLRERALLVLDTGAGEWHTPRVDITALLAALEEASAAGLATTDLDLDVSDDSGPGALDRMALLDDADRLSLEGRLLAFPPVPELRVCRLWLFGEIAAQAEGAEPVPWALPEPLEPLTEPARLTDDEIAEIDRLATAVVVADDTNRIIHVNDEAARMLGWDADHLTGQLEPGEAGQVAFQLTGEGRILGTELTLPALRADGGRVEVRLHIDEHVTAAGRQTFRATLVSIGPDR